jgi:4-hydroxybenzoyl-CoA reductase subunit beta
MLRLPELDVAVPATLPEALALLAQPGARLVAGGTDLLANLKHHLEHPRLLVSLQRVSSLRAITRTPDHLSIGTAVTLAALAGHEALTAAFDSVAQAASLVASPLVRHVATLGGNLHLDTRCRYVDQTAFWRGAIGGCLKSGGSVCHVVPGGQSCVAALSADTVPALISHDASLVLASPRGERVVPLADYYSADGLRHTGRADGEIATAVRLPWPHGTRRSRYVKWSVRRSIDFPLVSIALCFDLDDAGAIAGARVVAGALAARPRVLSGLDALLGRRLGEPFVADHVADAAHAQCRPLDNLPYDAAYRRRVIPVHVRRAIAALAAA